MQTQRYRKLFFQHCTNIAILLMLIVVYTCISSPFAQAENINTSQDNTRKSITVSLQKYGIIQENIILHIDIPKNIMPVHAWARVAIKSNVTLEDGSVQTGNIDVLEGVPETILHFLQKGLYELTISVGYLVKSA